MKKISPDTHQIKFKINPELPLLENKMFRCMAYIVKRGGYGGRRATIHNKDFPVNNNGGITRAAALAHGVSLSYKGYIFVYNGFKVGEYSKSYEIRKKGLKGLRGALKLTLSKAPIQEAEGPPSLSIYERINYENLKKIHLSNEFHKNRAMHDPVYAEQFYRSYRRSKGGTGRLSTDKNGRIYHPLTNMTKGLRKLISLDSDGGEPIVEVDIKCSNPLMMLKAGLVHQDEALQWALLIHKDRFYQKVCSGNSFRASSKRYVNSVFNGSRRTTRAKMLKLFPKTVTNMSKATGNLLMQTESKIMNSILKELYDDDVVVLRLHDAFLCRPSDAKYVSSKLEELGVATNIRRPKPNELMRIPKL